MLKTVCLQLLALLAILSLNVADAKALEEIDNEVLSLEKRDEALKDILTAEAADEEVLTKRDPENQEEEEKREEVEETAVEEKREEAEVTTDSESEATEVEDLKTRGLQARFTLVDYRGHRINGEGEGLLLFKGGTVCDDGFSANSAHAICKTMGYSAASHYRHGLIYGSFQSRKRIGLDDVVCSNYHWASCRSTTHHNCDHHEDILLTCRGSGFKLVNSGGGPVTGQREGLLTYKHGTVCDDYFNRNSAHAICRVMGFSSAVSYRHGLKYGTQQSNRRITMDNVRCRGSWWNTCTYNSSHNCTHREDVFLTCRPGTI